MKAHWRGYPPVEGVRVSLYDGSYHAVDSSEMAFKIAAGMAFRKGFFWSLSRFCWSP